MILAKECLRMHGKDTTAHYLLMAKQAQANLTPWLAMDKIRVNKCTVHVLWVILKVEPAISNLLLS